MNRRIFIEKISHASFIAASGINLNIQDEAIFWKKIKSEFAVNRPGYLYLNSGSAGIMPRPVLYALQKLQKEMNSHAPYQLWSWWQEDRVNLKKELAELIGATHDEIAIQRNTTEALNNILLSIPFRERHEIIAGSHEYPSMLAALKNRADRDQIQLKILDLNFPMNDEDIISAYADAIGPQTKYILISHMSFNHGRIFPLKQLRTAVGDDIQFIVDAAHSYAHIDFRANEIGANYLGTSLHKWLCAPHGTGLLYVKPDQLQNCYPLYSASYEKNRSMTHFEHLGTRAFHSELGIKFSLDYLNKIGLERKEKRLRHLTGYLLERLQKINGFINYTSDNPSEYCGILSFRIENFAQNFLKKKLEEEYGIIVKSTAINQTSGIRVSTNVFTLEEDLAYFADSLHKIVRT